MMKYFTSILITLISLNSSAIKVKKIGDLDSKLDESSGLEYYKGKIITHNDSGGKAELYIINQNGEIERTIKIKDAENEDWEDLAAAPDGRFFIGDIGNNLNDRKECQIYILDDDFLDDDDNSVKSKKIEFEYKDQDDYPPKKDELYYDAEAMFWMGHNIYILTKCRSKPYTGRSFVYVLPDEPGDYKARKIAEIPFCSTGWMWCSVTAADYDQASNTIAVLLYGKLVEISNFQGDRFWEGSFETHNIHGIKQREAIAYIDSDSWYMTDEWRRGLGGGNLYEVTKK